ncbi:carboxymuconolactone decarboxylase family protein [Lederbergia wuyishanensis]|uniref:AhpD family alkylhydroperoxidase n=1 Tax=Lederbergia wuyishanensis TaxID=1347903 RepID=A0ABU0D6K3_9BACI|nr:carboxymuconolactone decarboxylase family protein [Lederbergia wuyishanensis]MCJ8008563.1 carboxymuconolactone decarboxylase family protein [Lederbergia wuyishanensis]MDQ0344022.1 AhpD family alkylhydroperoxidase [Lederbergia wuyishanensis]
MEFQQETSIEQHLIHYKEGLGNYQKSMPELVSAFNHFTEAAFSEGEIPQKYKQLMALCISIYSQNEHCMIYHTKGCLDQGCSEQEIMESIGVAAAIGGGAVMSQAATVVRDSIEQLKQQRH